MNYDNIVLFLKVHAGGDDKLRINLNPTNAQEVYVVKGSSLMLEVKFMSNSCDGWLRYFMAKLYEWFSK